MCNKKQFNKISVFDLFDECPQEIVDRFLDVDLKGEFSNQSYTTIITQENDNSLATWLLEQGYPKNERVLIKISW